MPSKVKYRRPAPPPVVQRRVTRHGDHYWIYQGGRRISFSPSLALAAARRGAVRLMTPGDPKP